MDCSCTNCQDTKLGKKLNIVVGKLSKKRLKTEVMNCKNELRLFANMFGVIDILISILTIIGGTSKSQVKVNQSLVYQQKNLVELRCENAAEAVVYPPHITRLLDMDI